MRRDIERLFELTDNEIKIACEVSGIDYKDAEYEFFHFFSSLKELIKDERLPEIEVEGLGIFRSTTNRIKFIINKHIKSYRKGLRPKFYTEYMIKKLWYPYKRIIEDRFGKTQVIEKGDGGVGYFWSFVPRQFAQHAFPDLYRQREEYLRDRKIKDD